MTTEQTYAIDIAGHSYTIYSDDKYPKQFAEGFEPHMVELFRTLIDRDSVVFDIGANIGLTAILFDQLAATVHAFEPSPSTFSYLRRNLAAAGTVHVSPHNLGLGEEALESHLIFAADNRSGGFVSDTGEAPGGHVTETITIEPLDAVIQRLRPERLDLLKIDVEGFEGHVLRGGRHTLESYHPVVVMELNHWCLNAFQRTSIPDFFDLLLDLFPYVFAVDGAQYLDLRDAEERYTVMYQHIIHMRFPNIAAGFSAEQFTRFKESHRRGFIIEPPPPPPQPSLLQRMLGRLRG